MIINCTNCNKQLKLKTAKRHNGLTINCECKASIDLLYPNSIKETIITNILISPLHISIEILFDSSNTIILKKEDFTYNFLYQDISQSNTKTLDSKIQQTQLILNNISKNMIFM